MRWKSSYFWVEFVVWLVVVPVPRNDFGGHGKDRDGLHSRSICASFQKDHTVYINSSPHGSPEELLWGSEICQVSEPIWWRSPSKASDTCQRLSPTDMPNLQSLFQPQKPPIFVKQQCHFCDFFSLLLRWESDPPSHVDHFEDKLLMCKAINPNDGFTYVLYYIISYFPALIPACWKAIKSSHCRSLLGLAGSKLNCHSLQSRSVAFATRLADGQGGSGMNLDEFLAKWWRWWRVGLGDLNAPKRWFRIGGTL